MNDQTTTIQKIKDLVDKFRSERNWRRHHSSKNLAVSIAIEAAELMEHFHWDEYQEKNNEDLECELADIMIYCLYFAISNNIDIAKAVKKKVDKIAKKYPVKIFNHKKDDAKEYWRIKKNYRKQKTT
ncbi:dUTP diphosphatase [Candidatus Kaiserbacteria bacterium]|nr:dUTP diphosphatase [Candidatus Kaiserbacteria bacterium]